MLTIRAVTDGDNDALWMILEPILVSGEVFAQRSDMTREEALAYWLHPAHEVFVAEVDGQMVGSYYLRANQQGGGSHVANCAYMTATAAQGRGVASAMCEHSLDFARERGYRAMQFNFVISTNERAVRLWESYGFAILGRLPEAFLHPTEGYVDALVMYRTL